MVLPPSPSSPHGGGRIRISARVSPPLPIAVVWLLLTLWPVVVVSAVCSDGSVIFRFGIAGELEEEAAGSEAEDAALEVVPGISGGNDAAGGALDALGSGIDAVAGLASAEEADLGTVVSRIPALVGAFQAEGGVEAESSSPAGEAGVLATVGSVDHVEIVGEDEGSFSVGNGGVDVDVGVAQATTEIEKLLSVGRDESERYGTEREFDENIPEERGSCSGLGDLELEERDGGADIALKEVDEPSVDVGLPSPMKVNLEQAVEGSGISEPDLDGGGQTEERRPVSPREGLEKFEQGRRGSEIIAAGDGGIDGRLDLHSGDSELLVSEDEDEDEDEDEGEESISEAGEAQQEVKADEVGLQDRDEEDIIASLVDQEVLRDEKLSDLDKKSLQNSDLGDATVNAGTVEIMSRIDVSAEKEDVAELLEDDQGDKTIPQDDEEASEDERISDVDMERIEKLKLHDVDMIPARVEEINQARVLLQVCFMFIVALCYSFSAIGVTDFIFAFYYSTFLDLHSIKLGSYRPFDNS